MRHSFSDEELKVVIVALTNYEKLAKDCATRGTSTKRAKSRHHAHIAEALLRVLAVSA